MTFKEFNCLYKPTPEELEVFGKYWCGPDRYEHTIEVLVARYEYKTDGQTVEVFCTALPARFYTIRIEPWEFRTGLGRAQLAADIAEALSTGMLGFYGLTS